MEMDSNERKAKRAEYMRNYRRQQREKLSTEEVNERRAVYAQQMRNFRLVQKQQETEVETNERRAAEARRKRDFRRMQQQLETKEQSIERRAFESHRVRHFRLIKQQHETEEETKERRAKEAQRIRDFRERSRRRLEDIHSDNFDENRDEMHSCDSMNTESQFYHSLNFAAERSPDKTYKYNSRFSFQRNTNISFDMFPKNKHRREMWITAIGRDSWKPSESSKVCSNHFSSDAYYKNPKGFRRLKREAIPSILTIPIAEKSDNMENDLLVNSNDEPEIMPHPETRTYENVENSFENTSETPLHLKAEEISIEDYSMADTSVAVEDGLKKTIKMEPSILPYSNAKTSESIDDSSEIPLLLKTEEISIEDYSIANTLDITKDGLKRDIKTEPTILPHPITETSKNVENSAKIPLKNNLPFKIKTRIVPDYSKTYMEQEGPLIRHLRFELQRYRVMAEDRAKKIKTISQTNKRYIERFNSLRSILNKLHDEKKLSDDVKEQLMKPIGSIG